MIRELRGLGGGECYNVPVNLLTSCMLRELRGFWGGGNVAVNLLKMGNESIANEKQRKRIIPSQSSKRNEVLVAHGKAR